MKSILRNVKESWVYQEIGQQFLEQGLEKGRVQGLRQALMSYLQMRFPEITALAMQQTNRIDDQEVLQAVSLKLFAAQAVEEAKQILLEVNKQ